MHIFEFEIRYRSYEGLNRKFQLGLTQEQILGLIPISVQGKLKDSITKIDPVQLKVITQQTYSVYKKEFLEKYGYQSIGKFTVADYINRLEYELKVIKEMGFDSYFLIVQDFIIWSKKRGIPVGPGRGSAGGVLISYLVGVTDIDPLPYGLLFERFLNPSRISMPDIDIDFDADKIDEVLEYVKNKYGTDNCAKIGTFSELTAKAAFKDVARVMGIPFERSNFISGLLTEANADKSINIDKSIENNDELKSMVDGDESMQKTFDITKTLMGNLRQIGVHACGVIIAPKPLYEFLPTSLLPNSEQDTGAWRLTQFEGPVCEEIGMMKMDFLRLANLSIIKNTIRIVTARAKKEGRELDPLIKEYPELSEFHPPIDDEKTFKDVLQAGNTTGIFQLESPGMKRYLIQLRPTVFEDIVAMLSLYRPGPMEFIPTYIARKNGVEEIKYLHDELREELEKLYSPEEIEEEKRKLTEDLGLVAGMTYGVIVYQEQIMQMVQVMGGFSMAEADNLRKAVGKKIYEKIQSIKKQFVEMAPAYKNYKPETARRVYEKMIEPAGLYSFNKSHSAAYALITMQTAYLKAHYPLEYGAALLRNAEMDTDELSMLINELTSQGHVLLAPDVNHSYNHVAAVDQTIRLGFLSIKGVGYEIGETIEKEREKGGIYDSLTGFLTRCQRIINKKSLEGLIKAGALDQFAERNTLLNNVDQLLDFAKHSNQSTGGLFGESISRSLDLVSAPAFSSIEKFKTEYDVFKTFVSGHPFDGLYPYIKARFSLISQFKHKEGAGEAKILVFVRDVQRARKKGFFIKVEDISDSIEFFVKEPLGIKEFDILIVEGVKYKGFRLKKISKINHDKLVYLAENSGLFDPNMTVAHVKQLRSGEIAAGPHVEEIEYETEDGQIIRETVVIDDDTMDNIVETQFSTSQNDSDSGDPIVDSQVSVQNDFPQGEVIKQQNFDELTNGESDDFDVFEDHTEEDSEFESNQILEIPTGPISIPMPSSMTQILSIQKIIKSNLGDYEVHFGGAKHRISLEGYKLLQEFIK